MMNAMLISSGMPINMADCWSLKKFIVEIQSLLQKNIKSLFYLLSHIEKIEGKSKVYNYYSSSTL